MSSANNRGSWMLYAQVVLGIPVEGPFDYIVPAGLKSKIRPGVRVGVSFGNRRMLGYVVALSRKTQVKNLKVLSDVLDHQAVLSINMLLLTKRIRDYYCCSWGEAIETAIPEALRKGTRLPDIAEDLKPLKSSGSQEVILIHDSNEEHRREFSFNAIRETLKSGNSVIVLLPDMHSALRARDEIACRLGVKPILLYRKKPRELADWTELKEGKSNIAVGTRSAIFAPLQKLGLVIVEEEQDPAYKQDQVPHYHAREVAFMRTGIEQARLILSSASPSLEAVHLTRREKNGRYVFIPQESFPEIQVVGTHDGQYRIKQKNILSKHLQDLIAAALNSKEKILFLVNRRGFATFACCRHCGHVLKCPNCDINLVFHFQENLLNCYYCNFKMPPANICPKCNSGYIRYSGVGTEKIESELSRLFPQAKISRIDKPSQASIGAADICISTKSIIKEKGLSFGMAVAMAIDNSLNRIDFRAAEKTFELLIGLLGLTRRSLLIQTGLYQHHCLQALVKKDIDIFYREELKQRKDLRLPPFSHLCLVKLRGRKEEKAKEISSALFDKLRQDNKSKSLKIVALNSASHRKLRGKFCWQILIKANSALKITKFLKKHLKDFSHSGIIVTVDMDPL